MSKHIIINPLTRLEGHGKVVLVLDDDGNIDRAYFQATEFKGFEKFCEGRAAEEMPVITQKICGVCPMAHHIASTKALDALFSIDPPPAAKKVRELAYNAFIFEDHLLHFFFLGGCDFLAGNTTGGAGGNFLGVAKALGNETVKMVIAVRKRVREMVALISGSPLYPVFGLPGGISKPVNENQRQYIRETAAEAVVLALFSIGLFLDLVSKHGRFAELLADDAYSLKTCYMGMVDEQDHVNFYDGLIRIVNPDGNEIAKFHARHYGEYLREFVDPWSYMKTLYVKPVRMQGASANSRGEIYRVGPLGRLNASAGMATPLAQKEYERMFDQLGGRPVHHTLAYHWARLIEVLYAAEKMQQLADDPEIVSNEVRNIPNSRPNEGVGACEAPRGTLFHHYKSDERGIIQKVNLIVATQNNAAALNMSVEKAARIFVKNGHLSEGILDKVEMAYRAYDPCLACATHALPDEQLIRIMVYNSKGVLIRNS